MSAKGRTPGVLAAFPINDAEIVLVCSTDLHPSMAKSSRAFKLDSGSAVKAVRLDPERPRRRTIAEARWWVIVPDHAAVPAFNGSPASITMYFSATSVLTR